MGYPKALSVAGGFQAWKKQQAAAAAGLPAPAAEPGGSPAGSPGSAG
jgi:hypothetical protein